MSEDLKQSTGSRGPTGDNVQEFGLDDDDEFNEFSRQMKGVAEAQRRLRRQTSKQSPQGTHGN